MVIILLLLKTTIIRLKIKVGTVKIKSHQIPVLPHEAFALSAGLCAYFAVCTTEKTNKELLIKQLLAKIWEFENLLW